MSGARLALLLWIALLLAPGLAAAGDEERDGAAAQPAPSPPTPRTVVHRRGAGEPGEDGWVAARDERGQFAVELPGRFADYTQTGVAAERSITIHGLVHLRPGAFGTVQRFRATCTLYPDGPPPEAQELFEQAIGDQERRGRLKERRRNEIDIAGRHVRDHPTLKGWPESDQRRSDVPRARATVPRHSGDSSIC